MKDAGVKFHGIQYFSTFRLMEGGCEMKDAGVKFHGIQYFSTFMLIEGG